MLGKQDASRMRDPPLHVGTGQDCPSSVTVDQMANSRESAQYRQHWLFCSVLVSEP